MRSNAYIDFLASLAFAVAVCATPAAADEIENFYKGNTIKIVTAGNPGGGFGIYAQLVERHMRKYIPGNPNFITQYMPAAGGLAVANYAYAVGPQDGTVIATFQSALPTGQIMGQKEARFDSTKFNWLGSLNVEAGTWAIMSRTGIKTLDQLKDSNAIFGLSGSGNDTEIYTAMLINTMGFKFKLVAGYPAAGDIQLAMRRGEVDGLSQSYASLKRGMADLIKEHQVTFLAMISDVREDDMPADAPLILDYVTQDKLLPGYDLEEVRLFWKMLIGQKKMGRPYTLGPDVPPARVKVLREAFAKVIKDPDFLSDAEKAGVEITPISGEEIQQILSVVASTPKATLDKALATARNKR